MTDFLTADTNLPSYMMFPRFLLDMEINETAKMLYIILLDRARLSQKNEGWSDINGHVYDPGSGPGGRRKDHRRFRDLSGSGPYS